MSRLADYAIVLLTQIAQDDTGVLHSARSLAATVKLPVPTVVKVLKLLERGRVLHSHRGAHGGYRLARRPEHISVVDILGSIDGPTAFTQCTVGPAGTCVRENICSVRPHWQQMNRVVVDALATFTLADMATLRHCERAQPQLLASGDSQVAAKELHYVEHRR